MTERKLTLAHEFRFEMLTEEELELLVYGRIGDSFFEEGITAKMVGDALAKSPRAKKLKVKLSSPGGNVADGMAIRSMLATHPAHVTLDIEGLAASAGSVIAMAGDVIRMHDGASMMLHEGQTSAFGNAARLKTTLAALETINDGAATIYAARSGKTKEQIREMMAAETWLTPAQAKAEGFVDEVVPAKKQAAAQMFFDLSPYGYQQVPPDVAARCAADGGGSRTRSTKPKETEVDTMSYARIAIALGIAEGSDENAILMRLDSHKTAAARDHATVLELCELTGKQNPTEALGVARAYAGDHAKLAEVEKELSAARAQNEEIERDAIFKADASDPKGKKLTPAMVTFWKNEPVAKLKAFMESASYVVVHSNLPRNAPGSKPAPDGTPPAAGGGKKPEDGGTKSYADMTYMERHQLKRRDPELFKQLKQAHEAAEA